LPGILDNNGGEASKCRGWHNDCVGVDTGEKIKLATGSPAFSPGSQQGSSSMATKEKGKMLTAIFRDRASTERAFDWLQDRGYEASEINVLMAEKTRASYHEQGTEGQIKHSTHAAEGMAAGGAVGTVVGATLGAIVAIGTTIAIPGLGLIVAGPIVAALAGGGAGAVAGGAIGGLVGLGIPESNSKAYEEALKKGGVVFGVAPHSSEDAKAIRKYFEEQKADNIVYT
jgi:hypothetical protein